MRWGPPSARASAFFTCWTRKEAYLKAIGEGLSAPLASFSVSAGPDCLAGLRGAADADVVSRWSVHGLPAIPGYAAALAVEGFRYALRCLRWPVAAVPSAPVPEGRPEPSNGGVVQDAAPAPQGGRDEPQSLQGTVVLDARVDLDRTERRGKLREAR